MTEQYYTGSRQPADDNSLFNAVQFQARQLDNRMWTGTMVKVVAVHGGGGAVALVGTVDVQPLVNQVDGLGQNPTPHATIYGVPYSRLQGGATGAVICDPAVDDIGWAAFADHDISSVIANQGAQSNPGSARRFSPADAFYCAPWPTVVPSTYFRFDGAGNIEIVTASGKAVSITCGTATITADHANIISDDVNLGDTGGQPVARVGDTVSGGVITSGSSKVKAAG